MKRAIPILLLTLFAASMAHFINAAWRPVTRNEYPIGGGMTALSGADCDGIHGKQLYLRRNLYLPQQPRYGWLQVVGRDRLRVFVNGKQLANPNAPHWGFDAGALIDIPPYLLKGENVIAIVATQIVQKRAPAVAIDGGYVLDDGAERRIPMDTKWRCTYSYDRKNAWWFEIDFNDSHWQRAVLVSNLPLTAHVQIPPRSIRERQFAPWVTPVNARNGAAAFYHYFDCKGFPSEAWLRLAATGPYRLAINGQVIEEKSRQLEAAPPLSRAERIYDVSEFVQSGMNSLAVSVSTPGEAPHLMAELEVRTANGEYHYTSTTSGWYSQAGMPDDWHQPENLDSDAWKPCIVEVSHVGLLPWDFTRLWTEIIPPRDYLFVRWMKSALVFVVIFTLAGIGSWLMSLLLPSTPPKLRNCVFLALLPATFAMAAGMLAAYDPAVPDSLVYRKIWIVWATISVLAQWLVIAIFAWAMRRSAAAPETPQSLGELEGVLVNTPNAAIDAGATPASTAVASSAPGRDFAEVGWRNQVQKWRRYVPVAALIILFGVGFWLRLRNINLEPMHHDEVGAYYFTRGVIERGIPSGQIHADVPLGYCATSELVYYFTAISDLFLDDPVLVLRSASLFWSMATLLLIYYIGMRMFSPMTGLVAATLFCFSPYCIGMANFGRYFSQLQFFALLTTYLYWKTIKGSGPIDLKALWMTAVSFLAMYFSWEGSGFLAPGMVLAVLVHRRGQLRSVLYQPQVWMAISLVGSGFLLQNGHRVLQQVQRLWYGTGISELTLAPMWRYPMFWPTYFFKESSWIQDSFLPMAGLMLALVVAIRSDVQKPLRVMLIIFLSNNALMAAVLPLRSARYSYHLVALLILIVSATVVVACRHLVRMVRTIETPLWAVNYARAVGSFGVILFLVLASGLTVQLTEMEEFRSLAYRAGNLRFPHWEEPLRYVRQHMKPGDVVIAIYPHITDHTMKTAKEYPVSDDWWTDYWLQSTLVLQATLDDSRDYPLDRRSGTPMIRSRAELEDVLNRYPRIWYCTIARGHNAINDHDVSLVVRESMEVVYEDFLTSIMLRDNTHRPAMVRELDEKALQEAQADYLR